MSKGRTIWYAFRVGFNILFALSPAIVCAIISINSTDIKILYIFLGLIITVPIGIGNNIYLGEKYEGTNK